MKFPPRGLVLRSQFWNLGPKINIYIYIYIYIYNVMPKGYRSKVFGYNNQIQQQNIALMRLYCYVSYCCSNLCSYLRQPRQNCLTSSQIRPPNMSQTCPPEPSKRVPQTFQNISNNTLSVFIKASTSSCAPSSVITDAT